MGHTSIKKSEKSTRNQGEYVGGGVGVSGRLSGKTEYRSL